MALNRDKVVDAALAVADAEGLAALSMRRVAKQLGVEAMSLYNHVSSKGDLLDGMADRVLTGIEPPPAEGDWIAQVREWSLRIYRAMAAHPVVPLTLARDEANPSTTAALAPLEALLGLFYGAGLDDAAARTALTSLLALTYGSAISALPGLSRSPADPDAAFVPRLDPSRLPHLSRMMSSGAGAGLTGENLYRRGLDLLLAGLKATAG